MNELDYQQQLLRRLAQLSDERLLWRMRDLGYWQGELPPDPPEELAERATIEAALAKLQASAIVKGDVEGALKAERQRRFKESVARRAANKAEKLANKQNAQQAFAAFKETQVLHLGRGVSSGLQLQASSDAASALDAKVAGSPEALRQAQLPVLLSADALAFALAMPLSELRWLSYHREVANTVHYAHFALPKKTGGMRMISAPKPKMKKAQAWIWQNILGKLALSTHAHGFVPGRSSLTNAALHCGKRVVINMDVKDFFPSVRFVRVRELFVSFGYPRRVASILALLATESPRVAGVIAGDVKQITHYVALDTRALPQGACTSPALTNLLCKRLDQRMFALAAKFGFVYSRYADDLSFSGDDLSHVGDILAISKRVLAEEGFVLHPDKTKVMHCSQKQEVTGLSVNESTPHLPRAEKRRLRAMLHNANKKGLEAANIKKLPFFEAHLRGWVAYAAMAEPARAKAWFAAFAQVATSLKPDKKELL
jgi:RNA-directed DNA polymerase